MIHFKARAQIQVHTGEFHAKRFSHKIKLGQAGAQFPSEDSYPFRRKGFLWSNIRHVKAKPSAHLHLSEDGGPVVRDHHLPVPILDHLVHSPRAEAGSDRVRHRLRRQNVGYAHILLRRLRAHRFDRD